MSQPLQQQIVSRVVTIIEDPPNWTRMREDRGHGQRCAWGHIMHVAREMGLGRARADVVKLMRGSRAIISVNDFLGRRAVIRYLRWRYLRR